MAASLCQSRTWWRFFAATLFLAAILPAAPANAYERYINCSGSPCTSAVGAVYERDHRYTVIHGAGYVEGLPASGTGAIGGTADQLLFRSERHGMTQYKFDLPNGTYTVKLDFAETYFGSAGLRVFDVDIEGSTVLDDLDIYAVTGAYHALSYAFTGITVTDGQLNIEFAASVDNPEIRAIAVLGPADVSPPSSPSGLTATGIPSRAGLSWNAPPEGDVWGYHVERSDSLAGTYRRINPSLVLATNYYDVQVNNDREYFYRVRAIDYSSNTGSPSTAASATPHHPSASGDFFDIPDCAWRCALGDAPTNVANNCSDRGIAIGGFGAGSFMYNVSGSFGPWAMDVGNYAEYWLSEAAFHLYEKIGSGASTALCLSTRSTLMSAWPKLSTGDGTYYALQPRGWTTYDCFDVDASMTFFSPVMPHNYRESSYPVGVFLWKLSNPKAESAEVSIMFSYPNAMFHWHTRTGWTNFLVSSPSNGPAGIVLLASDPANWAETENTEWCIATPDATNVQFSYVISWQKTNDGSDVWNDFSDDGVLTNGALDNSYSAAAIAAKVTLAPGETQIIPFVLSWDFPIVEFGSAYPYTQWWKKYCEYYGGDWNNSFEIASEALAHYDTWGTAIDSWQQMLITNNVLPDWLKCAAFNELYYSQFGGVFWESGLKTHGTEHTEYRGAHVDDHKNFVMECILYHNCSPIDVRHYNSVIYAMMWPEMERDLLLNVADAILYFDPVLHQTPHDLGAPGGDPYFTYDAYGANSLQWVDLPSRYIQQVWRYYTLHGDEAFLDYVWPGLKATYGYLKTKDTDNDYLPNHHGGCDNTYDYWGGLYGSSSLSAGLWVGALEAMEKMAVRQDDDILSNVQLWLTNAKSNMNAQLWFEEAGYYKLDTEGTYPTNWSLMADGLNGERFCQLYGLDPIADTNRMRSTLEQIYDRCVTWLRDDTGDGVGDIGIINGIHENGSMFPLYWQPTEIWGGSTYYLSAMMYRAGFTNEALQAAYGVYYPVYEATDLVYRFNVPEAWTTDGTGPRPSNPEQYQRIRAVWELVFEMVPDYPYETPLPRPPLADVASAAAAWASSTEGVHSATYSIDGDWDTRWASEFSDPQWLAVDLGATLDVSRVSLHWEAASGKSYKIQASSNGADWVDVAGITNANGGHDLVEIGPPARTRYVRMYGTERNTSFGYSLWEFEVNVFNLAQGKPFCASSIESGCPANLAGDGHTDTRWSSEQTDDEWLQVDLGATYPVDTLILHWESAYASNYVISCSTDSNTWTDVYTNAAGDGGVDQIILTSPASARYVKMRGIQRATTWGYSLYEIQVFGRLEDTDFDGLNDTWEMQQFGTLAWSGADDPDCDRINNANEQMVAENPTSHPDDNDFDNDTMSNYEESLAGTDPYSAASYFGAAGVVVNLLSGSWVDLSWHGVSGRTYCIYWLDFLADTTWSNATPAGIDVNASGQRTWTDNGSGTGGVPPGQTTNRFYRLDVSR